MKSVALCVAITIIIGCSAKPSPAPVCPSAGELLCGNYCCPDSVHYACVSGQCQLISCDQGYQLCGKGCVVATANCCSQTTGTYCQTGEVCCGDGTCAPWGASCCHNGRYCPVGRVCCNNGQNCC